MYKLSKKSLAKLEEVHPHMQELVKATIGLTTIDFGISEGMRTKERQQLLFDQGKSQIMNSRHLTGHAVDIYAWKDGAVSWDFLDYEVINIAFSHASVRLSIPYIWGGSWKTFKDGPHFELMWGE
jgi:peptidoglycan L-alanyl-D-glutamate endopeptidase CwlK|tara:strand:+ start:333 stop:707 length:375 start_codon:yes stop_codon:yes gene_type:complete